MQRSLFHNAQAIPGEDEQELDEFAAVTHCGRVAQQIEHLVNLIFQNFMMKQSCGVEPDEGIS